MSDPKPNDGHKSSAYDLFGPARASMRTHLGEFVDVYMGAKIDLMRKLSSMISLESNPRKLMRLRAMMNDILFAEDDIKQLDGKMKAFLAMMQENVTKALSLRDQVRSSYEEGKRH